MADLPPLAGAAAPQFYQWVFQWSVSFLPFYRFPKTLNPALACLLQIARSAEDSPPLS